MTGYALLRALPLLLLLPSANHAQTTAPNAINDIAFVAQSQIAIDVTANDIPAGNVQIQSGSLAGAPVEDGRVTISNGVALFDPVSLQAVTRDSPFETFTYIAENSGGTDLATVRVYYFTGLRGTYFQTTGDLAGSGRSFDMITTLTSTGAITGKLLWDGEEYALNYPVSSTGRLLIQEQKKNGDGLLIADLTLEPAPPNFHNFTGTFRDTSTAAPLTANVDLLFVDTTPAAPSQMLVTFIDPQDVIGAPLAGSTRGGGVLLPEGVGFARVKPGKNGIARFQTTMPDYASFKKSYPLVPANGQTGRPARYNVLAEPYGRNRGKVEGEAEVGSYAGLGVDTMAADLDWDRFAVPSATQRSPRKEKPSPIFPGGFSIAAYLQGFTLDPSPGPRKTPQGFDPNQTPNADILLAGGSFDEPIRFAAKIDQAKGVPIGTDDPRIAALDFKLTMKFGQGFMSGSFKHPKNGKKVRFMGAMSSYEKRCRGVFLTPDKSPELSGGVRTSGRIEITPHKEE